MQVSSDARAVMLNALGNFLAGGKLQVFGGARPQFGAVASNPLIDVQLPSFTVIGGTLTYESIETNAAATGDPTWARLSTSSSAAVIDMSAGVEGELIIVSDNNPDSAYLYAGGSVRIEAINIGV